MDHDTNLTELMKQVEQNADELDRMLGAIRDLGDLPVAFSREALVEELGFDTAVTTSVSLPTCALRA
ncbi:MAG: hypothetical protein JWP87_5367 [Labilithrix sp.]|nr:hypothetical protein [Labilithrix sp.]